MSISQFDLSAHNGEIEEPTKDSVESTQNEAQTVDPGFSQPTKPEAESFLIKVEVRASLNELISLLPWDIGESFRLFVTSHNAYTNLSLSAGYKQILVEKRTKAQDGAQPTYAMSESERNALLGLLKVYSDITFFAEQAAKRISVMPDSACVPGSELEPCDFGFSKDVGSSSRRLAFLSAYPLLAQAFEFCDSHTYGMCGPVCAITPRSFDVFVTTVREIYQDLEYCAQRVSAAGQSDIG